MDLETHLAGDLSRARSKSRSCSEEMMESVREYSYELNPSTVERAGLRPRAGPPGEPHRGALSGRRCG